MLEYGRKYLKAIYGKKKFRYGKISLLTCSLADISFLLETTSGCLQMTFDVSQENYWPCITK